MDNYEFSIQEYASLVGERLDKCVVTLCNELSRSYVQNLIDDEHITVNGKPIKSNYKVRINDLIVVSVPEPEILDINPENIELDIVYEDNDIIVINKPKGMVVHPSAGHLSGTIVNALMYHCKDNLSTINGVIRPGIVHRIDMDTTGLIVACKNDVAHKVMSDKFKVHDITRVYSAIVYNYFSNDEGVIDLPINRHKADRKRMAVDIENGRHAVTHYKVISKLKNNFSLIECRLETGRTHQIRVHMAYIKHPLLGDEIYGPKTKPFNTNGQVLHAGTLGFNHPITGEYLEFHSELPDYFKTIITKLS